MKRLDEFELLISLDIRNPQRYLNLIKNAIRFWKLDLSGLIVLTEAASGPYAVTPLIAAMSGAKEVYAISKSSPYAGVEQVIAQIRAMERLFGIEKSVKIAELRNENWFGTADIITNLGFVRPLDAAMIAKLKKTAVIPLMFEAWEFRPDDIDLVACKSKDIGVFGTNESFPGMEIFAYSGWLAMKLLFEAQIEVFKSRIIVISSDRFGEIIVKRLNESGAKAVHFPELQAVPPEVLSQADALFIADYRNRNLILGPDGEMEAGTLAKISPGITVVLLAGWVDLKDLQKNGIIVYPQTLNVPNKMSVTLANLGPRPIIELNSAGLKVGEITARAKITGQPWQTIERHQGFAGLVQEVK